MRSVRSRIITACVEKFCAAKRQGEADRHSGPGDRHRERDAEYSLHERREVESDSLFGGEGGLRRHQGDHLSIRRSKASGSIATSPVNGKSRFTMV